MRPITKLLKAGLVAGLLTLAWWQPAWAQATWFVVEVKSAGVSSGSTMYMLLCDAATSPAFCDRWFLVEQAIKKETLATALTAMSNNLTVWALVDTSLALGQTALFGMYMRSSSLP